jgi:hypothetical protein
VSKPQELSSENVQLQVLDIHTYTLPLLVLHSKGCYAKRASNLHIVPFMVWVHTYIYMYTHTHTKNKKELSKTEALSSKNLQSNWESNQQLKKESRLQ